MKTWDDLSDLEISKNIGFIVGSLPKGKTESFYEKKCPDYCNNPADMWPIIVENGISLVKLKNGYQAVSSNWNYMDITSYDYINDYNIGGDEVHQYGDKNPLRAAAIVFLMMNGVKP